MMWYYGAGDRPWMWVLGALMMLVFWGGLTALAVWAVVLLTRRQGRGADAVEETLKRRLAAGEISLEDYEKTRRALGI